MPPGMIQTRTTPYTSGRSAAPQVTAPPLATAPPPLPAPPPIPAPVQVRPARRISPITRSKSPPKIIRRAESPSKPRSIINDTINIERLKLARDEAERAMKVHN